jgi:glycosyltransferase involved in cell wall biosynthesis
MELKGENIICFAGEDWWYHNPHSNLHIMKSFSIDNKILFINSIGTRAPDLKQGMHTWKKIWNKLKSFCRYFRKAQRNIYVLTPIALPQIEGHEYSIQKINNFLIKHQIILICKLLNFNEFISWVCIPTLNDTVMHFRKTGVTKCIVYYCVDNISYFSGKFSKYILESETLVHKNADIALFVNHELVEERTHLNPNTYYLSHGVDYEHFAMGQNNSIEHPFDLKTISKPIVGYIGAICGLDFELVKYLSKRNKHISYVFIGDVQDDISSVKDEENVYFLGKKAYQELPMYIKEMSCLAIYYKTDDVFNQYRNPKKLLEYLASGCPIVSVPILEINQFKDMVFIAHDREQYEEYIKMAIYNDTDVAKRKRMEYAMRHTWDDVANEAAGHIKKLMQTNAASEL